MRQDILSWKHFKGGRVYIPYLELFQCGPISDEEFRYLVNNSSENVARHEHSSYNPVRECLNSIYYKDKFREQDLTELDNSFIDDAKVNYKIFLSRIKKAPISESTFERLIDSKNTTTDFDRGSQHIIERCNEIRLIANKLHEQSKYISDKTLEASLHSEDKVRYELEEKIKKSQSSHPNERKERLLSSNKYPEKIQIISVGYKRNSDVIVEALARADGVCENCHSEAPFIRKKDDSPYLEVHHKVLLSRGGEDTLENAIALCPNCHREMHFGKNVNSGCPC